MKAAFGKVVDVKPAKSLGVTRIVLEIPVEFHKEATSLFFDQHALLTLADDNLAPAYGILDSDLGVTIDAAKLPADLGPMVSGPIIEHRRAIAGPATRIDTSSQCYRAVMLCKNPEFHLFLGCDGDWTEQAKEDWAKREILTVCGITSRKELDTNQEAFELFYAEFVYPFARWKDARK